MRFEVEGLVRGKGRPRFVRTGGNAYTPRLSEHYENWIRWNAAAAIRGQPPLSGPLSIKVEAELSVPQSWSPKKRKAALSGELRPEVRPDFDNIAKIVADALSGICYWDDKQICTAVFVKRYAEEPRLVVEINEIGP